MAASKATDKDTVTAFVPVKPRRLDSIYTRHANDRLSLSTRGYCYPLKPTSTLLVDDPVSNYQRHARMFLRNMKNAIVSNVYQLMCVLYTHIHNTHAFIVEFERKFLSHVDRRLGITVSIRKYPQLRVSFGMDWGHTILGC